MRPDFSGLYVREIGEKDGKRLFFILDPDAPTWTIVNQDGLEIIDLCNGKRTLEEISEIISKRYGIDEAYQIVGSFLEALESLGFLKSCREINFNEFRGVAIEVTKKCNLSCIHCYLSAGHGFEPKFEQIANVLDAVKRLGGNSVAIGGGEPLVRKDWLDIIEYALTLDLLVVLGTNGTRIDEETAKLLSELSIKIQISIDGASEETHDHIRGKGSFKLAIRGLQPLLQHGNDVLISFTPMKPNLHEVPKIIDFALKKGIPIIQFPPLAYSGRAKENWEHLALSTEEKLWFWKVISRRSIDDKIDLLADCFSINIESRNKPFRCSIGSLPRIDPEGNVYPCQCFHSGYRLGNAYESNLEDIVSRLRDVQKEVFRRVERIPECAKCRWRNYCGGGCAGSAFNKTGTIFSPESCEVRRAWIEMRFNEIIKNVLNHL